MVLRALENRPPSTRPEKKSKLHKTFLDLEYTDHNEVVKCCTVSFNDSCNQGREDIPHCSQPKYSN